MKMRLFKRSSIILPVAFSVQPSNVFDQGDGQWSTFNLQVGGGSGGPQNFRVVVSTSSFDTWLPLPESSGCPNASISPATCASMRGVGFYAGSQSTGFDGTRSNSASSDVALGIETLDIGQLDANTLFGTEYGNLTGYLWEDYLYMSSSTSPSTSHSSSSWVPIYGIGTGYYYLASFGIGYGAVQTAQLTLNSTLSSMAASGTIPSVSWGYTAGAYYGRCNLGAEI
jgi:hypothetical protein